jgi:hypothetical protein
MAAVRARAEGGAVDQGPSTRSATPRSTSSRAISALAVAAAAFAALACHVALAGAFLLACGGAAR